jgi:hypothetical protein
MNNQWTKTEERILLFEIKNGIDPEIMIAYHKRTFDDIFNQINIIASKMIDENISVESISKFTKLPMRDVRKIYNKKSKKQPQSLYSLVKSIKEDIDLIKNKLNLSN